MTEEKEWMVVNIIGHTVMISGCVAFAFFLWWCSGSAFMTRGTWTPLWIVLIAFMVLVGTVWARAAIKSAKADAKKAKG